ncbi:rubrerythrin family protein [Streptomyces sp. NEAU-W12]|uniref:rubrerythrin family protein n=1 Tax=Streptomyces sp. NEAU-W12 TaxID=2994668 RepID=UPI00224AEA32|nr:rubrerythrin family protein [Streptomyces sp. NEAU-W12]MCX2924096.1 rubrerythrin family protein [Streptomyces sp. NEAU-W12]
MAHLSDGLAADLRSAIAAEATAALRYTYFAQIAEVEGHTEIGQLFTELAESTRCVVHGHLDVLRDATTPGQRNDIGDTPLNVASAVVGALQDAGELYPRLASSAHAEGHADVASWLTTLTALKKRHTARFDMALTNLTGTSGTAPLPTPHGATDD